MSELRTLYEVCMSRMEDFKNGTADDSSYTCYLYGKGVDKICKKCGEEATEMVIAAKNNDNEELKNEVADLFYHVCVLCANQGLDIAQVEEELANRSSKIGNKKQFHVTDKNS